MSQPGMQMIPGQRPDPLAQGDYLMDGAGPFAMADAMAAQQAEGGQTADQQEAEKQILDRLKQEQERLGNSNKIKEMSLKLVEEMQKAQELEARMQEHPEVEDMVMQLLQEQDQEDNTEGTIEQ